MMFEAHTFCIYNYLELLTAVFGLDLATLDARPNNEENVDITSTQIDQIVVIVILAIYVIVYELIVTPTFQIYAIIQSNSDKES